MVTVRVTRDSLQGHAGDHLKEWPPEIKTILLSEKVLGLLLKFLDLFHVSFSSTVIVRRSGVIYGCCKFLPILFYWLFLVPEPSKPRLHSDNLRQRNKLELTVSWLTVLSRPGPPARQLGIRIVFHKRGRQKHWTNFYNSHSSFAIHCFRSPQLLVYCYKMTRLKKAFRRNI